jgi:hypothetical protein
MIRRGNVCLAVRDARYASNLTHVGLAKMDGIYQEKAALTSALRVSISLKNLSGTLNARRALRIVSGVTGKIIANIARKVLT